MNPAADFDTTADGQRIIYADLQPSSHSNYIGLTIKKCPICSNRHYHGTPEGSRVSHCRNKKTGEKIAAPEYFLKVDWSNPKNSQQRKAYEALLTRQERQREQTRPTS